MIKIRKKKASHPKLALFRLSGKKNYNRKKQKIIITSFLKKNSLSPEDLICILFYSVTHNFFSYFRSFDLF